VDASSFVVEGVEPARVKDVRDILKDFFRSPEWDVREPGDGKFLVKMTDAFVNQVRDRTVKEAIRTLERRVNQLGVAEPVIAQHGARGDQILVQLPGVTDVEQAKRVISTTAPCRSEVVEDNADSREALLEKTRARSPTTWRSCRARDGGRAAPSSTSCARRRSSPDATSRTRARAWTRTTSPT
jgi:preprotein translocase subunit SecD